jgi:hypothetical protein
MIHAAFTIYDNDIHIIVKNGSGEIVYNGTLRTERGDEIGEWLACKAAIREAGDHATNYLKLYSDCSVIRKLMILDPQCKNDKPVHWPEGYGPLPQITDPLLYHFYDALTMLWRLFKGQWEAVQISQERILNNGHRNT